MEVTPIKEVLRELHRELLVNLVNLIKSGEAKAADRAVAWQILKDNRVEMEDLSGVSVNEVITDNLPFVPEDLEQTEAT